MATSPEPDYGRALEQTRLRLAAVRERRKAHWRGLLALAAGIFLLMVLGVAVRRSNPTPPRLVIVWPRPKEQQTLQPSDSVLLRPGQPLDVTTEHPESWSLRWQADSVEETGPSHKWSAMTNPATLVAYCRPAGGGWRRFTGWMHRPLQVKLQGVEATPLEGLRRRLPSWPSNIWVFPRLAASAPLEWDERALPLLLFAAHHLPPGHFPPGSPLWRLVPGFDGAPAVGDDGTYARLETTGIQDDLTAAARTLAAKVPGLSIKFVVHLEAKPAYGIIRLAFDGKADHAAWVRRAGDARGGPLQWDEDAPADRINPEVPARIGR